MSLNRIRKYIGKKILPKEKEEVRIEKLSATGKIQTNVQSRSVLLSQIEERRQSTVKKEELETLYHIDGLTFRQVNKYIDSMIGPGFFLEGDKDIVDKLNTWIKNVRLKRILEEVVRDIFVTGCGNAWVELGYTEDGKDIQKLRIINPKSGIDYIRDQYGNVLLDENGDPMGYKQERSLLGEEVIWKKDEITVGGKRAWKPTRKDEDGRDRIAHFKLFGLGESYLGMSPLEPIYRDAIIRLNLTDNVGETGFRGGGIVAYVGEEDQPASAVPDKYIDQLARDLENVSQQDVFVFRKDVKLDRFPIPDLKGREDLIYYFVDVQCAALGIPLPLLLEPKRSYKGDIEFKAIEFEHIVTHLQEKLAEQIEDKILSRVLKARGINVTKTPKVVFRSYMPTMKLSKARRIGKLFRDGVMTWDPELEKRIRKEEGLPTKYLEEHLEKIKRQRKKAKNKDLIKKLDDILERMEESE